MPITTGDMAMTNNLFLLFQYLNLGRIGRMNGILVKLSIEQLLEEFTQTGGISALSALFSACVVRRE